MKHFKSSNKASHIGARPLVLSCAGFDPSAGAGLLGDLRAMDAVGVYGMAVETCSTVQNDIQFLEIGDRGVESLAQIRCLALRFDFTVIKVGLVPSMVFLHELLALLDQSFPKAKVIWDPILSASAGFDFEHDRQLLHQILNRNWIDLWTPNLPELQQIFPTLSLADSIAASQKIPVSMYLKGGHGEQDQSIDELWQGGQCLKRLCYPRLENGSKHGSGCHLSALIAAFWAKERELSKACVLARSRLQDYLASDSGLLGFYPLSES